MHITQAEHIAALINTRDEFLRVKNILVTDLSSKLNGPCIFTAPSADIVVGNYKVTLSKPTIKTLLGMMDSQCKTIEQKISNLNAVTENSLGSDGADTTVTTD